MAEAEDLNPSQCAFDPRHRHMKTYRVYANYPIPDHQDFVDVKAETYEILDSGVLHFFNLERSIQYFGAGSWFTFDEVVIKDSNEPPF